MPRRRNLKLFLPSWTFHVTHHGFFAVIEQGSQGFFHADGLVKFPVFYGGMVRWSSLLVAGPCLRSSGFSLECEVFAFARYFRAPSKYKEHLTAGYHP